MCKVIIEKSALKELQKIPEQDYRKIKSVLLLWQLIHGHMDI
jgi:mRNA-degrading endonuclease RelE of RelBE toxin-antitoxin system